MPRLVTQPTDAPTRKVTASAVGAAIATLIVWGISAATGADIPPGAEGSLAVLLGFLAGYFVREADTPGNPGT